MYNFTAQNLYKRCGRLCVLY